MFVITKILIHLEPLFFGSVKLAVSCRLAVAMCRIKLSISGKTMKTTDRQPAVAGKFYPAHPDELQKELGQLFAKGIQKKHTNVRAIISPHAGFIFSGRIAASAFNQMDSDRSYKRIIILASSHREYFQKAAVFCSGNFEMPYGVAKVDIPFALNLVERHPDVFTSDNSPHQFEHSIEVQLPFLHYKLKKDCMIVPIILGTDKPDVCKRIAAALKPYFNADTLFVISTDFSHYPEYSIANKVDEITMKAIVSNNPEILLNTLSKNQDKQYPHMNTSLCGWTSVLTLLYITYRKDTFKYHEIEYCNSGDSKYVTDTSRVVGYWGIVVSEEPQSKDEFHLTDSEKKTLLNIARDTLDVHCKKGKKYEIDTANYSDTLKAKCGVFVTLNKKGVLRGCIGMVTGLMPLYTAVQEMAISAASHDYRFKPMKEEELTEIEIEISVLSPMTKITNIEEIILGKHGIFIQKERQSGLFLPQVATETRWTKEDFLGHCARDKAHLGWDGWKTAHIYIFTATVFSEKNN